MRAPLEVGEAANAVQAMERLQHAAWDVLLLDIQMPGIDGLTAMPDLVEAAAGTPILIVSSIATRPSSSVARNCSTWSWRPCAGRSAR